MARGITVGVLGDQKMTSAAAMEQMIDLVDSRDGKVTFVFPVTEDHTSATVEALIELAQDKEWTYITVTDGSTKKNKNLRAFLTDAAENHQASDAATALVDLLAEKPGPRLWLVWDGESDNDVCEAVMDRAKDASIPCYSFLRAGEEIIFDDEDDEEDEDETEPEDVEDEEDDDEDVEDSDTDEDEDEEDGSETDSADEEDEDEDSEDDVDDIDEMDETGETEDESDSESDLEEDEEDDSEEDDEESEDDSDEEEDVAPTRTKPGAARKSGGGRKLTETYLKGLSQERLYEIGAEYGVFPGKGIRSTTFIRRVLEAAGGGSPASAPKRSTRAPAKKTAAPSKVAAPSRGSTKTASTSKKATPARTAASSNHNGPVGRREARALLSAFKAFEAAAGKVVESLEASLESD